MREGFRREECGGTLDVSSSHDGGNGGDGDRRNGSSRAANGEAADACRLRAIGAQAPTNNPEDAQDLTQETLVRAFDRFHTFNGDASAIPGWLRTILRNQFINQWRRHKNDPALVSDEACAEAALVGPSPETITLNRAEASALLAAVAALPPMYRQPLTLADMDGLSYQEISDELALPLNTVRSRIHRARQKVQKSLAPWRAAGMTLH
jgi:RNA polymerase sigma-70 factor, ECF subfamily